MAASFCASRKATEKKGHKMNGRVINVEKEDLGSNGKTVKVWLDDGRTGSGHDDGWVFGSDGNWNTAYEKALADANSKSVPKK
jgi:hypothetical protein